MFAGEAIESGMGTFGTSWEKLASKYTSRTMPAQATLRFVKLCEAANVDIDKVIADRRITLTWVL